MYNKRWGDKFSARIIFIKKLRKSKITKVKTEKIAVKSIAPVLDKNKLCRCVNKCNKIHNTQNIVNIKLKLTIYGGVLLYFDIKVWYYG